MSRVENIVCINKKQLELHLAPPAAAACLATFQISDRHAAPVAGQVEAFADMIAVGIAAPELSFDDPGVPQFTQRWRVVIHVAAPLKLVELLLAAAQVGKA